MAKSTSKDVSKDLAPASMTALTKMFETQLATQKVSFKKREWNPYIKVLRQAKMFQPQGEENASTTIKCVIMGMIETNHYTISEEGGRNKTICMSVGAKYGFKFGECATCQYKEWKNDNPPTCNSYRKLAVILDDNPDSPMFELRANYNDKNALNEYMQELTAEDKALSSVVTKITIIKGTNSKGKLIDVMSFENVGDIIESKDSSLIERVLKGAEAIQNDYFGFTQMPERPQSPYQPSAQPEYNEDCDEASIVEIDDEDDVIPF